MKRNRLIIFLLLFHFVVIAQKQAIDSLKDELKSLPLDTVRVNTMNSIASHFIEDSLFDSASHYVKTALDLAEKLHYIPGAALAYYNLAEYNFYLKEYKTGKNFLLKSLEHALAIKDRQLIANNYLALADLYQLQGNFKWATDCRNKYALYNDSLLNEERAKQAAEIKIADDLKEKERAELAANDAKALTLYEAQRQKILYISLGVLAILTILIIWLLVSRAKVKAQKKAALNEAEILETNVGEPIALNKVEDANQLFLQKIAEKEALLSNSLPEKVSSPIIPAATFSSKEEDLEAAIPTTNEVGKNTYEPPATNENSINIEAAKDVSQEIVEEENIDEVLKTSSNFEKQLSSQISIGQLKNFAAKLIDNKVKLDWHTLNEENFSKFNIEKSVDNVQFVRIETIAAKGDGNNIYEAIDLQTLPGINYYRIEIIDTSGNFVYSTTVSVEVLPATTLELICYPTQVKDVIMITAVGTKSPVSINIFDKIGKKQFSLEIPAVTTPVYLNALAAGVYTLQMKCQGKNVLQQLTKID